MSSAASPEPRLPDADARERFIQDVDQNFSVIAAAGAGKTRALVERIARLARHDADRKEPWLPHLVVVTYANSAADEMQERARAQLVKEKLPARLLNRLGQSFFGSIHSFCVHLLRRHGHALGLPARLEVVAEHRQDALWLEFIRQRTSDQLPALSAEQSARLLQQLPLNSFLNLARNLNTQLDPAPPGTWPDVVTPTRNLIAELTAPDDDASRPKGKSKRRQSTQDNFNLSAARLQHWLEKLEAGEKFAPIPMHTGSAKELVESWPEPFTPAWDWIAQATLFSAAALAREYQQWRLSSGRLLYSDQIELALNLMHLPGPSRAIRQENYRVLLDEAQDTDSNMFRLLTSIACPPEADLSAWLAGDGLPPILPGRFCMVGDPQQAIYPDRADVSYYIQLNKNLAAAQLATTLQFSVTQRCSQKVVEFLNPLGPGLLNGQQGQASYVQLQARPGAALGSVERLSSPSPQALVTTDSAPGQKKKSFGVNRLEFIQANTLADWIASQGFTGLGASSWAQVAIILPRNDWLVYHATALRQRGVPVELLSQKSSRSKNPGQAWFCALLAVATDPTDAFELVGLLREIFGCTDDAIYRYQQHHNGSLAFYPATSEQLVTSSCSEIDPELRRVLDALALIEQTRRETKDLSAWNAARLWCQNIALKERLQSLEIHGAVERLDTLLMRCCAEDEAGRTLREISQTLRQEQDAKDDPQTAAGTGLQLLTCHKAKGLEWEVVILPSLGRKIKAATPSYPRFIPHAAAGRQLSLNSLHRKDERDEILHRHEHHNNQRLLYVTLTRAKQKLYLFDDSRWRSKDNADTPPTGDETGSFLSLLRNASFAAEHPLWGPLPSTELETITQFIPRTPPPALAASAEPYSSPTIAHKNSAEPLDLASLLPTFPRRVLPHTLAQHLLPEPSRSEPEARLAQNAESSSDLTSPAPFTEASPAARNLSPAFARAAAAGRAYGLWWHDLMQFLPWAAPQEEWQAHLTAKLPLLPDDSTRARAQREWQLFLHSRTADTLRTHAPSIRCEVPFSWLPDTVQCVEGIMDLLAPLGPQNSNGFLLLDWKTDRPAHGETAAQLQARLVAEYQPQLGIYARALSATFRAPVTPYIHSTATGQLIPLSPL